MSTKCGCVGEGAAKLLNILCCQTTYLVTYNPIYSFHIMYVCVNGDVRFAFRCLIKICNMILIIDMSKKVHTYIVCI